MAGIYGFLHDQISFTVSPEYFTEFKFIQFHISPLLHNRIGAGVVGIMATWWMGIVVGVFLIPIGLIIPGWKKYLSVSVKALLIAAATALIIGTIALVYGLLEYNADNLPMFGIPSGVNDRVGFSVAGNMHNFSYAGGMIGILTGIVYICIENMRIRKIGLFRNKKIEN